MFNMYGDNLTRVETLFIQDARRLADYANLTGSTDSTSILMQTTDIVLRRAWGQCPV